MGSVVVPGWSHVVAPSTGRGSCIDSRCNESGPLTNPCGCRAPRPTTVPADSATGASANSAAPDPRSTTTHSSESGCVCWNAGWSGPKPCREM